MKRILIGALAFTAFSTAAFAQQSVLQQSGLVGKLEGPAMITDPAQWPKKFGEAPMLAELVKAGKLPPVEQRIPQEPMVLKPLRAVGKYGGTLKRGFMGTADSENGNRFMATDKPLFFDITGTKLVPNVVKAWTVSPDGKVTTLSLRKGMKWSDGSPFTADDFVFWFEDVYQNKDLVPAPALEMAVNGKPGRIKKVDEITVALEFDEPYFLLQELLGGSTLVGGGQSNMQSEGLLYGLYSPAHYLKQYLPKNSSVEALNQQAKQAGFDNWVLQFKFKADWRLNKDLPTLGPWKTVQPINTQIWLLERNPYYYVIDSSGNQLPYIDRIQMTLAENAEVINLRAISGQYDYQDRFIDLAKLPVILENRERSKYRVQVDLGFNGSDNTLMVNQTYKDDPEIAKWLRTPDFRRALSLGINRQQINDAFFLGLGTIGSAIPADAMPHNPGPEWRTKWSTHDPKQANELLDKIGLTKKDSEGYRVRPDNGQRLRIEIQVEQSVIASWPQQAEMIVQHWKQIGIQGDAKFYERGLATIRVRNDQDQLVIRTNSGTENVYLYPRYVLPVEPSAGTMSAAYAQWFSSDGVRGTKPDDPEMLKAFDLLRSAPGKPDAERTRIAQEIWKIVIDQQYAIGTVGQSPAFMGTRIISEKLENVPERTCISQHCRAPGSGRPEQWFFKP
jgi:peptide/nickel transport system substrate-binding protein